MRVKRNRRGKLKRKRESLLKVYKNRRKKESTISEIAGLSVGKALLP